ncbi:corticotropin-releasing factor receptor 1 [Parasteatoda tepidariorum]|uniref:corticotropin-releasing factor receptor 1 n=1 Tax=Parasteatoda tepidariorum TaxID=114398 RepID=UPI001C727F19|nr:corticotropin-releasing factor receptor 1 [Parasteatoda tepidariorum]
MDFVELPGDDPTIYTSTEECVERYRKNDSLLNGDVYCEPVWDSVLCWPSIPAGQTAWKSCLQVLKYGDAVADVKNLVIPPEAKAYRICDKNGNWLWGNWTNYNECLNFTTTDLPKAPLTVSLILLVCSLVSLFFLALTIFIFFYFKSLQCSRLRVHRNLIVALIIHSLMLVIISLPVVGGASIPSYRELDWLCKIVVSVKMYAALSSINWMFVEGMLLHSRITTNIFQKDAPFKLYYFIGWGIPLVLILSWCLTMNASMNSHCWEGYGRSSYVWIITGPMIGALGINLIFLVNIIRILVTKMKTSSTFEIVQIRRAMKATALLFPLLGITHLLFCVNPRDESKLEEAYMITNASLQSSQGIFVSILYCFMNIEVQTVLRKAYVRAALRRNPNHRYTWKCRTSQNSTYVSNCDTSVVPETATIRPGPSPRSVHLMREMRQYDKGALRKYGSTRKSGVNGMNITDV